MPQNPTSILNCPFHELFLHWTVALLNELFLDWNFPLLNSSWPELFFYWLLLWLNCSCTELFLYWSKPLLLCSFTDLFLTELVRYWTIPFLSRSSTEPFLCWIIPLLNCFFAEPFLFEFPYNGNFSTNLPLNIRKRFVHSDWPYILHDVVYIGMLPRHVLSFWGTSAAVTVGKTIAPKRLNICFALISLSLLTTMKTIH